MIFSLFLAISAVILLTLSTFSTPFIKSIYFLSALASIGGDEVRYGAYGYCFVNGSCFRGLGYGTVGGGTEVIHWLTVGEITIGLCECCPVEFETLGIIH